MTTKMTKWTGTHGTNLWFDAKNWGDGVPAAGEATSFSDGGTWTISLTGSASAQAGSLTVTGDLLTFTSGTLALTAPAALKGQTEDLIVKGGGSVTIAAGATLTAATAMILGATTLTATTTGTLAVAGTVDAPTLYAYAGALSATGSAADLSVTSTLEIGTSLAVSAGASVNGGGIAASTLQIGSAAAEDSTGATASITGSGSALNFGAIDIGDVASGLLSVAGGASVTATTLEAGVTGNGTLAVTGPGSTLAFTGATIGGNIPVASTASITAGGTLAIGSNGLTLVGGTLALDGSATLSGGSILSLAGVIEAEAVSTKAPGTVTLNQQLVMGTDHYNDLLLTTVFTTGNAVLNLAGGISSSNNALLEAAGGTVILSNAGDAYGGTQIGAATLEIATNGAAGAGSMTFLSGVTGKSILQIDAGVSFGNAISQFGPNDQIDLQGFAFATGEKDSINGTVLTINDGSSTTSLTLAGFYNDANFTFSKDKLGGTLISFHTTT